MRFKTAFFTPDKRLIRFNYLIDKSISPRLFVNQVSYSMLCLRGLSKSGNAGKREAAEGAGMAQW